jgi:hypothetical protein
MASKAYLPTKVARTLVLAGNRWRASLAEEASGGGLRRPGNGRIGRRRPEACGAQVAGGQAGMVGLAEAGEENFGEHCCGEMDRGGGTPKSRHKPNIT